jgi:hypothetical protein
MISTPMRRYACFAAMDTLFRPNPRVFLDCCKRAWWCLCWVITFYASSADGEPEHLRSVTYRATRSILAYYSTQMHMHT